MSFRFVYQKLLQHRKTLEDIAQRDVAEANANLMKCRQELDALYKSIDDSRTEAMSIAKAGGSFGAELSGMDQFIMGQNLRIQKKRLELRELQRVEEELMAVLVEKSQEKKVLEKLREKRMLQHRKIQKKREAKALDDISTMKRKS